MTQLYFDIGQCKETKKKTERKENLSVQKHVLKGH